MLASLILLALPLLPQDTRPAPMGWTGVLDEEAFAALHELKGEKAPPPRGVRVEVGGRSCYLSLPEGAEPPLPAVLVVHEWWGLNEHVMHWADRLAADGYAALAVDLYGGVVATTREEASAAMRDLDEEKTLAHMAAAHRFLGEDPRIRAKRRGAVGWCLGGGYVLLHALQAEDLDAAVVYYGRLVTDAERLARIRAPVLGVFGDRDRGIPPESVDAFQKAMAEAGRELRVLRYDAEHAFANPSGARYDAEAAAAAWREVRAFLAARLKAAPAPAEGGDAPPERDKH